MYNIRKITDDLTYIGCSNRQLNVFESAYPLMNGMAYNSYFLKDEKNVLFDTVDKACSFEFMENLEAVLAGEELDYLVVHHMEPDHSALLLQVKNKYPNLKFVCSSKAVTMIKQFFTFDNDDDFIIVKEGDVLKTGKHELQFFMAPMVHWPEVMVTYDRYDKVLYTADAFGSFGAISGNLFDDEVEWKCEFLSEARRYYTNIVGKYGLQVQMLLKKISSIDIKILCPLHGLLIRENIQFFIEKYDFWSKYLPEKQGVLIAYSSVYGGTENTVNVLASKLSEKGVKDIKMYDVSLTHSSFVLADAFKYSHIVLASTTYNAGIFETMECFLNTLLVHNLQNRKYVVIQNGSWAPACGKQIIEFIEKLKNSEIIDDTTCIKSVLKENQIDQLENVVSTIVKSLSL